MAGIYTDQHHELGNLLAKASNDEGASLLIPGLQRPFVRARGAVGSPRIVGGSHGTEQS